MEFIVQSPYYKSFRFKIFFFTVLMVPVIAYIMTGKIKLIYADLLIAHIIAFVVSVVRYLRKKAGKQLDFELALAITVVDLVSRHYLPPMVTLSNNLIIFSLLLLFLYRQLRLSIKDNIIFLMGYGAFYFLLSYKYLHSSMGGYWGILYSVLLSFVFAYTLLAVSKINNFYRSTFCGGVSLLCLILLGKRVVGGLDNAFVIAQASITVLNVFTFIYWYEGKEFYAALSGRKKAYFNTHILVNLIGLLIFICYLFDINVKDISVIWGLVVVVALWYFVSIFGGLVKTKAYTKNESICEGLTNRQLERLDKHARHLTEFNRTFLNKLDG